MIIGHGDIASALYELDRQDITFFASGVSNSREVSESKYNREMRLLMEMPRFQHLVYFSSLSIYYNTGRYVQHKIQMEQAVHQYFAYYTIVRIGNIYWGKNPNTLINYIRAHPEAEIHDVTRYILSKFEFQHWIKQIRVGVCDTMNITGVPVSVVKLAKSIREEKVHALKNGI